MSQSPSQPAKEQQVDGNAAFRGRCGLSVVPPAAPQKPLTGDKLVALRSAVYSQITTCLPMASCDQFERFAANLALCRGAFEIADPVARARSIDAIYARFGPRVFITPDLNETYGPNYGWTVRDIEQYVRRGWANYLHQVPGFYQDIRGLWRLALPTGCAVYPYRAAGYDVTAGLLLQPLKEKDRYWLLTSAKHGGPKATPLSARDVRYFEQ